MKRQFFPKHNILPFPHRTSFFGIVLVALTVSVVVLRVVVPSAFFYIATPILRIGNTVTLQTEKIVSIFTNTQKLITERDTIFAQNMVLARENLILEARVQELTALMGTSSPVSQGIVADVLSRPPESPYDMLIVDAGGSSGVKIGDMVLARGGIPIGYIVTITSQTAQVRLLSSSNATTTSWVGATRIPIILHGSGAGTFVAYIPRGAPVTVGDIVFASSYRVRPVGTVIRIDTQPTAVARTLYIRPFVNIFSLTMVEIVPSPSS